jgi:hypothetical protein
MKDRSHYPVRISDEKNQAREDLSYWLSRPPEERIAAVELLREQFYALQGYKETPRIKKVITVRKMK